MKDLTMDGTQSGPPTRSLGVSSGEFRAVQRDTHTFEAVPALVVTPGDTPTAPQPNLHYVFDDPNDGEPGRDRLLVHILWELVLAVGLIGAGFALVAARPGALKGDSLRDLALVAAWVGMLAIASALGLRAAVPNLAVGAVALFSAHSIAGAGDGAWGGPTATALGICAAIGLAQGLLVVVLQVPSWAVSLGVAVGLGGWVVAQDPIVTEIGYDPEPDAYLWLVGVAAVSVVASVIGAVKGIRRGFGRYRPVADQAKRRTTMAAVIAVVATVVSTVIAGLAGALFVTTSSGGLTLGSGGMEVLVVLTAAGLGAALLGGTSAHGRRGGIFGTALAACLVVVTLEWVTAAHPGWAPLSVLGVGIGIGIVVTRLVERFGKPVLLPPDDDEPWMPGAHAPTATPPWRPGPTPAGGLWSSDEGWGNPR
jgi:hypothetical protein